MLTDFLLSHGFGLFVGGWMQFGAAFGTAFLIMLLFGRSFIRAMHKWQKKGQPISENVPESHRVKAGTPTMGGVLIVTAILVAAIAFMPTHSVSGWISLLGLAMFAVIGFMDDYKIRKYVIYNPNGKNYSERQSNRVFRNIRRHSFVNQIC